MSKDNCTGSRPEREDGFDKIESSLKPWLLSKTKMGDYGESSLTQSPFGTWPNPIGIISSPKLRTVQWTLNNSDWRNEKQGMFQPCENPASDPLTWCPPIHFDPPTAFLWSFDCPLLKSLLNITFWSADHPLSEPCAPLISWNFPYSLSQLTCWWRYSVSLER